MGPRMEGGRRVGVRRRVLNLSAWVRGASEEDDEDHRTTYVPESESRSVDLPEPDGPMMATTRPGTA